MPEIVEVQAFSVDHVAKAAILLKLLRRTGRPWLLRLPLLLGSQPWLLWPQVREPYYGCVLIRERKTGLSLPSAPEFGLNGRWPPEATEWVPLNWQIFETKGASLSAAVTYAALRLLWEPPVEIGHPLTTADALQKDFLHDFFDKINRGAVHVAPPAGGIVVLRMPFWSTQGRRTGSRDIVKRCRANSPELRRVVHSVRWRRKDPVTKLPPGSTNEIVHSLTTGLSIEHSELLADSLGLTLGTSASGVQAKLSSELQRQFALKINFSAEENRSSKIVLQNTSESNYRLYALWHVEHSVTVTALDADLLTPIIVTDVLEPRWRARGSVEFMMEGEPHITYTEVSRS